MADKETIKKQLLVLIDQVARAGAIEFTGEAQGMTPVRTGALRANWYWDVAPSGKGYIVYNRLDYAQKIMLEGKSRQLPAGEFQAAVARIPQLLETISGGVIGGQ